MCKIFSITYLTHSRAFDLLAWSTLANLDTSSAMLTCMSFDMQSLRHHAISSGVCSERQQNWQHTSYSHVLDMSWCNLDFWYRPADQSDQNMWLTAMIPGNTCDIENRHCAILHRDADLRIQKYCIVLHTVCGWWQESFFSRPYQILWCLPWDPSCSAVWVSSEMVQMRLYICMSGHAHWQMHDHQMQL